MIVLVLMLPLSAYSLLLVDYHVHDSIVFVMVYCAVATGSAPAYGCDNGFVCNGALFVYVAIAADDW